MRRSFPKTQRAGLLALAFAVLAGACRPAGPDEPGFQLVVSFHALATMVEPVVGPAGSVTVLLPAGANPHAFEPRPSDLRTLSQAQVLVLAGPGVDTWADGLADVPSLTLANLVADSLRRPFEGRIDPHFWLDPVAVRSTLPGLVDALCRLDPAECSGYQTRGRAADTELRTLHGLLDERTAALAPQSVVVSGPFLTYWSARFGPEVRAVVETREGVEPSAEHVRAVIARARGTHGVVGQPSLPAGPSRAVAEGAGVPYVVIDPIGSPATTPAYADLLYAIADTLLERLDP